MTTTSIAARVTQRHSLSAFGRWMVGTLTPALVGGWCGRGWIWTALALFLAFSLVMSYQGRLHFELVRLMMFRPF